MTAAYPYYDTDLHFFRCRSFAVDFEGILWYYVIRNHSGVSTLQNRKILIIDDDADLSMIITDMLESKGFFVSCAQSSREAFDILGEASFELILLDINLPDNSGFEVCKQLREVSNVPVIFASARTSETDRITGFDIGGDDYLPKPYSMKELLSRINALLRRSYGSTDKERIVTFGEVSVNITSRTVTRKGKAVNLSLREFDLLAYLCEHKNEAISKDKLINEVWGAFSTVEPSTLTVHIRWLREKLEQDPASPVYIKTVWGVGYILEAKDEK